MGFIFIRIDDRVIHGQLSTRWSKEQKCEGIVAVDDHTAKDHTRCSVLKSAVPETVRTFIFDVDTFAEKFAKIQESPRNYFLIVKSPLSIIEKNIPLNFTRGINVGPMSTRDNSVTIGANASILP